MKDIISDMTQGLLNMVQVVANNSGMILPPSIFGGILRFNKQRGAEFWRIDASPELSY